MSLYLSSAISAGHLRVICYWAFKAGVTEAKDLSHPPGRNSGHYQRHLDTILGFKAARQFSYTLTLAGQQKGQPARSQLSIPTVPPHEAAEACLADDPTVMFRLEEAIRDKELPPSYFSNPVVQNSDTLVMPWGFYMDAIPYSLVDSAIGCWLINLISGVRELVCILRKNLYVGAAAVAGAPSTVCCVGCGGLSRPLRQASSQRPGTTNNLGQIGTAAEPSEPERS